MTLILSPYDEEAVRRRAYQYWLDEGKPDGRHEIHWQWALADVMAKLANSKATPMPAISSVSAKPPATVTEDITLISGIGKKIAGLLQKEGITTLTQIAAMTEPQLAALDADLELRGRSKREAWIVQAKELTSGKAPRAKTDR